MNTCCIDKFELLKYFTSVQRFILSIAMVFRAANLNFLNCNIIATHLILWAIRYQIKCITAHKHLHLWDTREGPFPFRTFVNGAAKCISLLLSYCYWFCNLVMLYPSQEDNGSVSCATHILYQNLVLCNLSDTKDNHTRYCMCKILILLHDNSKNHKA